MSRTRIYQAIPLATGAIVRLDEKATHHLVRVLRANIADKMTLFNGQGGEYEAVIARIDKKNVDVEIIKFITREAESTLEIHLAQGIARGEKMDFIVQKAVELGVTKIIPLITERCNVRLDHSREEKRLLHWQAIVISACEQSGRNRIPVVITPLTLQAWIHEQKVDCGFVLSPHVQTQLDALRSPLSSAALLIGPEGGLSADEVELATSQGFHPLNLGPRILRAETATIAAVALLQCQYGDMR